MRGIDGVLYCNDGDRVESLNALVEHAHGRQKIARWSAQRALVAGAAPLRDAPAAALALPDAVGSGPAISRG